MSEISQKQLENFLKGLMEIERRYSNEEKNKKSNRQADLRELLEKFIAKEFKNDN
jgi:hypothetical protein